MGSAGLKRFIVVRVYSGVKSVGLSFLVVSVLVFEGMFVFLSFFIMGIVRILWKMLQHDLLYFLAIVFACGSCSLVLKLFSVF